MALRVLITVLCGVGLYASLFMLRKSNRAAAGQLMEPSVVHSPRARLFGGVSNALLGTFYYPALAIAVWLAMTRWEVTGILAVALFAAGVSVVLAYSLLFVTRMRCVYCWTSHVINWSLAICVATLLFDFTNRAL